jgi:pyruvate/2-oxoglutarate dehydrogenase complex dihydrolipoamide dehydrogenase (E3) component
MSEMYDVAVIGGGTAGLVSGVLAKSLGAKTVLIEKARIGGECLWTGCVPSKALIKSARVFDTVKRAEEFGVHVEKPRLIWSAVKLRIADVRDEIKALERRELDRSGLEIVNGTARFQDAETLLVQTRNGKRAINARKFIVACGTKVRTPDIAGLDEIDYLTHENVFDLPSLPRSMTIIGGGPIACELAQAFARFGTQVTLLQKADRLLTKEDAEISTAAQRVLEQEGVSIHLSAEVQRVAMGEDEKLHVQWRDANGSPQKTTSSRLLVATGKTVELTELNPGAAGIQWNRDGVVVDDYLRTTAPNIWACGDVTGQYLFTHVAEYQAKIAAQNALLPLKAKADYRVVPWTTFTDPEISHLGLTEDEARHEHGDIKVYRAHFKELDRAIIEGETSGFIKVVTTGSGRIVGVHIIGASAGETIHSFVGALHDGALIQEFAESIFVYPTLAEIGHRAGNEFYKEALQSPTARWLLQKVVR